MNARRTLHDACRTLSRRIDEWVLALRTPATVYQEMRRGMLVGGLFALSGGVACELPLLAMTASAVGATFGGAVVGLVLWSGSADLPEERVVPPAPGQERRPGPPMRLGRRIQRAFSR